jgi:3-hydroxyacyl-CoA dehydrogenase
MRPTAIVGTGSIGVAFAILFASSGRYVRMWDALPASLERARTELTDRLELLRRTD